MDVRHRGSGTVLIANLIVYHHGIMNIPDQTTQLVHILDIVEKTLNLPLICQWPKFLENSFQFPDDPC